MITKEIRKVEKEIEVAVCDICKQSIGEFHSENGRKLYHGARHAIDVLGKDIHADCLEKLCV